MAETLVNWGVQNVFGMVGHPNLGLADAKVDRAPVLALTGQVQTQVFGPGAFQDIDLSSAFQVVTKFSQLVLPSSHHAELMSLACKTALVERDVAHLIFPDDVQTLPTTASAGTPAGRSGGSIVVPAEADLAQAVAMINAAKRPMIVIGTGPSQRAMQSLRWPSASEHQLSPRSRARPDRRHSHPRRRRARPLGHTDRQLVH
jgi:thiamine pyrophosphate-dependent acetolactate synthase large subunit-like protein